MLKKATLAGPRSAERNAPSVNMQMLGIVLLSVLIGAVGQLVIKAAVNSVGRLELAFQAVVNMAVHPVGVTIIGLLIVARSDQRQTKTPKHSGG